MMLGASIIGLGGAIVSGAAALAAGHGPLAAIGAYSLGGSLTMLTAAIMALREPSDL